jgi:predicted phosphate transport protein (TIGR00153 family)
VRLTPRDTRFFDLLTTAAGNLVTGSGLLSELVSVPMAEREKVAQLMHDTEHLGDDATQEIMLALNTSFITPFDRQDIQLLASRIDDVLDDMDEAADLAVLYRIDEFPPGVTKMVELLCRAAALTADAMPGLRKVTELSAFWQEINAIEDEADGVYRRLLAHLFNDGWAGGDPLTVLKTKEIVDRLESAADAFEHVADVVQTIAVKES